MPTNRLSDLACRRARPRERPYKLFDGLGLALWVSPTGARVWRLYYRVAGRQQTRSFGAYPGVSLAKARELRDAARAVLDAGSAPPARQSLTLADACRDYWAGRADTTERYRSHALRALEMHLWPTLGAREVRTLTRADLLAPLVRLDAAGRHEYARRTRTWASLVLAWCVERGDAADNVAASIRPATAFGRRTVEHHAAVELTEVGELMHRLDMEGMLQSAIALRLLALTWARTGELRMMLWSEIDGDVWRLPAGRMKRRRDHLVPLSRQALALIATMRARAGDSPYVFPAPHRTDRPMSENAMLYLLGRMDYGGRMTGHGMRTVGSTWAHEHGYPPDVIERQLAHVPTDRVRDAYNRAAYLPQRREMLQAFADWLDAQAAIRS